MPNEDQDPSSYKNFSDLFWVLFSAFMVVMLVIIFDQSSIDIFFIDWEKSKLLTREQQDQVKADPDVNHGSVWRTLLVANEFNEILTERYINIELLFLIFGFIMKGLNVEAWAVNTKYLTTEVGDLTSNVVLKYFLVNVFLFGIGCVLWAMRQLLMFKVPSQMQNFSDLCSVANISIFL